MPFTPAVIAAIISAATTVAGFGLEASGALTPGAPHLPPTPKAAPPALSQAQIASLTSPAAAQAEYQTSGSLTQQGLFNEMLAILRSQRPDIATQSNFEPGVLQAVSQIFGSSSQPGLTTTGITSV